MIQIRNVTKLYPAKAADIGSGNGNASSGSGVIRALDDISLHVEPGEWLSIMGPSGSGKSTLVNLIGCLDRPSAGEVWLDGQNVAGIASNELDRVRAEKIGFIFQQFHLIPFLTAVENVMLAQYFHSMTDEKEASEALRRIGLGDREHHLPSQLSGRSSMIPRSSWLTSPPAIWTHKMKKSCCACCANSTSRGAPS